MKVIGIRASSFKGDRGDTISGQNVYLTEPLEKGEGLSADRVFILDSKLDECGYSPKVGDEVRLEYNRYGKCSGIIPLD